MRGVETSKPGLVILDLSMLRMNGVAALKKIKKCLPENTVSVLNALLHKNVSLLNGTAMRPGQPFPLSFTDVITRVPPDISARFLFGVKYNGNFL